VFSQQDALSHYITEQSQPNVTVILEIHFDTQDRVVANKFIADNQQRKMIKLPKTADVVASFAIYSIDLTTPVAAK
jgi:2',3'-cyclic-nucleotide 2'-phosphodiesterase/3'-nucleotidase